MNILILGESSTGKSSLASKLVEALDMILYTGKDYLRLSKNKNEAIKSFKEILNDDKQNIIYVATEKDQVDMVPDHTLKILCKASLETKIKRFATRFHGHLPKAVEDMIKRKDGMFDAFDYDLLVDGEKDLEENTKKVIEFIKNK